MPWRKLALSPRRHLDGAAIAGVVTVIHGWEAGRKIAWEPLADRVGEILGHRWTRQALERCPAIKNAYLAAVERSRDGRPQKVAEPAETVFKKQIDAARAEIAELKRKLAAFEELFVRHHHNAQARGIGASELAAPMPPVDRRQTDGK